MGDGIRVAADELRRELEEKIRAILSEGPMADILKIHRSLNDLEDLLEEPRTTLNQIFVFGDQGQGVLSVRPDEFYGLSPLDAAKRYLKKRGSARPFSEIVAAIRDGGCRVTDEPELKVSLGRSTFDIAKVGDDLYGLLEFYPHIKRGKRKKGEPASVTDQLLQAGEQKDEDEKEATSE